MIKIIIKSEIIVAERSKYSKLYNKIKTST